MMRLLQPAFQLGMPGLSSSLASNYFRVSGQIDAIGEAFKVTFLAGGCEVENSPATTLQVFDLLVPSTDTAIISRLGEKRAVMTLGQIYLAIHQLNPGSIAHRLVKGDGICFYTRCRGNKLWVVRYYMSSDERRTVDVYEPTLPDPWKTGTTFISN